MSAAPLQSDLPNVRDGYRRLLDVLTAKAADYAAEVNKLANSAELAAECRVIQYKYTLLFGEYLLNVHSNCALFAKRGKRDGTMTELPAEFRAAHRAVYDMLVGLSRIPKICKLAKVNEQIGALVVAAAAAAAAPPAAVGGRRRASRKARGGDDSACATGAPMDYAATKSGMDAARAAIGLAAAKGAAEADAAILAELVGADAPVASAVAAPVAAVAGGAKRRSARRAGAKGV